MSNTALDQDPACAFAVNLKWSRQPITRESLPDLPVLRERYLYLCKKRIGDELHYGIRAGFFPNGRTAARFAASLRSSFAAAEPVLVCSKEFSASASAGLPRRRDSAVSKPKPAEEQRVTSLLQRPNKSPSAPSRPKQGRLASVARIHGRTKPGPGAATSAKADALVRSSEPSEPFPEIKESRAIRHPPLPFLLLAAAALLVGWQFRQETNLMAELGFGYALSFVGGAMMLVLLLFPLRNKSRFVRNLGPVKHWFDTHILLGVLGSVLIALQNDFISSSNGRVVLFSTLFIAATGFVGRYFYTRIHESTRRITLQDLERDVEAIRDAHASVALVPEVHEQLVSIEDRMLSPPRGLLHSAFRTIGLTLKARWTKSRLARIASRELKKSKSSARITPAQRQELQRSIHGDIVERLRNVRRTARFSLHESLFRLWHALHYPLLVFLVAAGSIHALAAHV